MRMYTCATYDSDAQLAGRKLWHYTMIATGRTPVCATRMRRACSEPPGTYAPGQRPRPNRAVAGSEAYIYIYIYILYMYKNIYAIADVTRRIRPAGPRRSWAHRPMNRGRACA